MIVPELIRWNDIKRLNQALVGRRIVKSININHGVTFRRVLDNGAMIDILDGIDGEIGIIGYEEFNFPDLGGRDSVITGVRLVFAEKEDRFGGTQVALVADHQYPTVATSILDFIDCDSPKPECPFVVVYYPSRQATAFGGTAIWSPGGDER